jgi:hypothetical protein
MMFTIKAVRIVLRVWILDAVSQWKQRQFFVQAKAFVFRSRPGAQALQGTAQISQGTGSQQAHRLAVACGQPTSYQYFNNCLLVLVVMDQPSLKLLDEVSSF